MNVYSNLEREILMEGITAIIKNIYNMSDINLLKILSEVKEEKNKSKEDLWDDLILELENELSMRHLLYWLAPQTHI